MRFSRRIFNFSLIILLMISSIALALEDARLLREPDVYGDTIVFRYANDLWTVPISGGLANRLTSHPGTESDPYFSPDGKWIAFSGEYDGNTDVYIIPAEGGKPVRLTYHPGVDIVTGWSNDGKSVLFLSRRDSQSRKLARLWKVSVDGGMPEMFPIYKAYFADMSEDGKYLVYSPKRKPSMNSWKRYRGGCSDVIWILNLADLSVKEVKQEKIWNDSYPLWMGTDIYFISDRDRTMNLYKYDTLNDKTTQLTNFKDIDIKSFGLCKKNIIIEQNGYLHSVNPETGALKQLKIDIPSEQLLTRPHFEDASKLIFSLDISPTGKRAVFGARGEIVTVPAEKGDVRNITGTPCKMERTPVWSPDGKWIAYFGEENKEYTIKIVDQMGGEEPNIITIPEPSFFQNLVWSPDSKKLAFNDIKLNLYYVTIEDKKITKIDRDPSPFNLLVPVWSPDSEWIAYGKSDPNRMNAIYLYSLQSGKITRITDDMCIADNPVFDKSGKYLYFTVSTDATFSISWLDLTSALARPTNDIYLVVLDKNEPSPFKPESDEESVKDEKKDGKKDDKKKEEAKKTKIDLDGIIDRIVSVDIPGGRYFNFQVGTDNIFYYLAQEPDRRTISLNMYDVSKKKGEQILAGIGDYSVSADGKKILYMTPQGTAAIADAGAKITPGKGSLNLSGIKVWIVPKLEWEQILYEAWRFNRDWFYDPGMHGRDWPAIWEKYKVYLPYVSHRDDLTYVMQQMIGELSVGHAYMGGGLRPEVESVPGGLLGSDYVIDSGYYKIEKIYRGENWNPQLRSPLAGPGIDVKEGDYILAVNGIDLKAPTNIYALFQNTAGKQVTLKINSKPEMKGAKDVVVVPIINETFLRHKDWIDNNKELITKLTDGKIGYVYLPDTTRGGFTYFNRYYFAQLEKEGLIMDERYNSGGSAADYFINEMTRKLLNWWQPRYGLPFATPGATNYGKKVMLIDEMAGSGGDYLPFAFRAAKVGTLIGTTTWGGLVGISGYPPLMDGGFVTAPSFGFVDIDGNFTVENEGVSPDIEVDILPADFKAGKDTQLLKAIEVIMEQIKDQKLPKFKHNGFPRKR